MRANRFLTLSLILLAWSAGPAFAQNPSTKSEIKTQSAKTTLPSPKKKKRLGTDRSELMPEENTFGFVVTYWAGYDQMEQVERKTLKHQVGFSGSYSFSKAWSAYSSIGFGYQTFEDKVYKENDDDSYSEMSNLDLGVVYAFKPVAAFLKNHSNTFNISVPVSEESRTDHQYGEFALTNYLQTVSWKGFSLYNRFTADFLWNRLKFSIYNDGELNRDWALMESFGFSYQVLESIAFKFGFSADNTHFIGEKWDLNFGNQASLVANVWGAQLFASLVNRSYPENERFDFGYQDNYRRLVRVGITYAF